MINRFGQFGQWLKAHDIQIDLITVWALAISSLVIAVGFLVAWMVLRDTEDQTRVGVTLKWQKLSVGIAFIVNSFLYWALILISYETGFVLDFWDRMVLRIIMAGSMLGGAFFVSLFVVALIRERAKHPPGPIAITADPDTGDTE